MAATSGSKKSVRDNRGRGAHARLARQRSRQRLRGRVHPAGLEVKTHRHTGRSSPHVSFLAYRENDFVNRAGLSLRPVDSVAHVFVPPTTPKTPRVVVVYGTPSTLADHDEVTYVPTGSHCSLIRPASGGCPPQASCCRCTRHLRRARRHSAVVATLRRTCLAPPCNASPARSACGNHREIRDTAVGDKGAVTRSSGTPSSTATSPGIRRTALTSTDAPASRHQTGEPASISTEQAARPDAP